MYLEYTWCIWRRCSTRVIETAWRNSCKCKRNFWKKTKSIYSSIWYLWYVLWEHLSNWFSYFIFRGSIYLFWCIFIIAKLGQASTINIFLIFYSTSNHAICLFVDSVRHFITWSLPFQTVPYLLSINHHNLTIGVVVISK